MIKPLCPNCNEELDFYISVCKDEECCAMPDEISCNHCYKFELSFWNYDHDEIEKKWIELGGSKEDLK